MVYRTGTDVRTIAARVVNRLEDAVRHRVLERYTAAIMHDFSIDWVLRVDDFDRFVNRAQAVLSRGGGLLPDSSQVMQQGGCAANAATTLGRLGVRTRFFCRTDAVGLHMMNHFLGNAGVDLSGVKQGGDHARVVALEVGSEVVNIMVNDQRSFTPFGFDDLSPEDLKFIESADVCGIFDWTLNPAGTDLAGRLLSRLESRRPQGSPITFLDTSDPAPRKDEVAELFARVLSHRRLNSLNLNENELRQYSGQTGGDSVEELLETAHLLKKRISASLCVHTARFSLVAADDFTVVPTYRIDPVRSTGAGDTWNGGYIAGQLMGMEPAECLLLANATAAYYVTSPTGQRPTLTQVAGFIAGNTGAYREI